MKIRIIEQFAVLNERPFRRGELLTVSDELAEGWIAAGKAEKLAPKATAGAPATRRDKAVKPAIEKR